MAKDSSVSRKARLLFGLCVAALLVASAGLLLAIGVWVALGLAFTLFGAALALAVRWGVVRRLAVAATAMTFTLTCVEALFVLLATLAPASHHLGNYSSREYWNRDEPTLGYAPQAGAIGSSAKIVGGVEVYRATYSIDQHARRRTAAVDRPESPNCLFFFGDSMMFGEGLNDADTLPWIVQEQAGRGWRAFNFAFHGYGPHQMLAAIESGRVQQASSRCAGRTVVITQYSEQHVGRALGRASWDHDGPWYVLDDRRGVVRAGSLDQRPGARPFLTGRYRPEVLRWLDWQRLFMVSDADRRFFVGLVATARDRFAAFSPAAEWHLILYDTEPNAYVTEELERRGVRVHPIRSMIPDWRPSHPDYSIPRDGHPNRRYNEILGGWIQAHVLNGLH